MLTLKDVIAGNTYYAEYSTNLGDYAIINCDKDCNLTTSSGGIQISKKEYWESNGWSCKNNIRLATDEEKAWLEHCIKEDKFVEYEEFIKVYKPQFIVGKWYKNIGSCQDYIAPFVGIENGKWVSNEKKEYIYKNNYRVDAAPYISKNFKNATLIDIQEIQKFLPLDHPDKQLDIKQIQEECKKRFPIGCKFRCANTKNESILRQDEIVYEINDSYIYASGGQGCLYYKGKYAELIETPEEETIVEYVECIKGSGSDFYHTIGNICKVKSYNKKEKLLKLEGYENTIRNINLDKPFSGNNTDYKKSSKKAYDLQNFKQQPLIPEQCYNTEIEVGDEVEVAYPCSTSGNTKGHIGYVKSIFQGGLSDFGSCQVYKINGWCEHISALRLIKKANKNTITTTLNKKVDVSSPKVTDKITVPRINTTSYDTLVHINIETNTKSIKIPKLETNTPEIKKIKIQSLTLTI